MAPTRSTLALNVSASLASRLMRPAAFILAAVLLAAGPLGAAITYDANGYTVVEPAADSRIVYVSDSMGSDSNDGLSEATPVKTISAGLSKLRWKKPDQLLLKRGDTWTNQHFGYWNRQGGRSAEEPMVISYYGDPADPRPTVLTGGESAFKIEGSSSAAGDDRRQTDHFAIIGLHLKPHTYDGTHTDSWGLRPVGIRWGAGTEGALVEDCLIEGYGGNLTFEDFYNSGINNITVRRNVLVDAWAKDDVAIDARAQGIYTSEVNGLLIEENVFDHNGWKEGVPGAEPTIYAHNMYIQYVNYDVEVRGNIVARASAHGLQLRPGGILEGNVFTQNSLAAFLSDGDGDGSDNRAADNVFLDPSQKRHRDGLYRASGLGMMNIAGAECVRNIAANGDIGSQGSITGLNGVYTEDNVVYNWDGYSDPGPFPDPNRSLASYNALQGGGASTDEFLFWARQMERFNFDPAYTAAEVVRYFQEGFGLADLPPRIPGDANRDGVVSDADYTVWADNYGASDATWEMGDFNGNGTVTEADYTIWADNYGATAENLPVPEPATMAVLSLSALGLLRKRRS